MNHTYYRNAQGMLVKVRPSYGKEVLGAALCCAIVAILVLLVLS